MARPVPSQTPKSKRSGLTLGATVGIAIGVALIVILSAAAAFIIVRRRRRAYGAKRKAESDKHIDGDTPNDEIEKKVEFSRPQELATNKEIETGDERSELAGSEVDVKEKQRPASELYTESNVHEMPTARDQVVEIGDSKEFVAELDSTPIAVPPTIKEQTTAEEEDEVKPLSIVKSQQVTCQESASDELSKVQQIVTGPK